MGITLKVGGDRNAEFDQRELGEALLRFQNAVRPTTVSLRSGDKTTTPRVQKVDLSCRKWTVDAISVLEPLLVKVAPDVMVLDLSDIIAGLVTHDGLQVMGKFTDIFAGSTNVEEIFLSDNAMGPRALEKVATLLGSKSLKGIYLNNCGLSAETIPQLDLALKVGGQGHGIARLRSLALDKNMIGVEGAQALGALLPGCFSLTSFSFCGCRPGYKGSTAIAQGILRLADNGPDSGCRLKTLRLKDFTLYRDDDEKAGLIALVKALKKMPKLTHLNLGEVGELGEAGPGLIGQSLIESRCKLVFLDLSGCELSPDGVTGLQDLLKHMARSLKNLHLEINELGYDGVEKIVKSFADLDNVALEHLHLDENELEEDVIDVLLRANFPKLRQLTLKDNDLEDVEDAKKEQLGEKFPKAAITFTVLLKDKIAPAKFRGATIEFDVNEDVVDDDNKDDDVVEEPATGMDGLANAFGAVRI